MEKTKQEYYSLKEDLSILSNLSKRIWVIDDIISTYNIGDMPLKDVKDFLEERYLKIDNRAFETFKS